VGSIVLRQCDVRGMVYGEECVTILQEIIIIFNIDNIEEKLIRKK
jgi:hypothetical protein